MLSLRAALEFPELALFPDSFAGVRGIHSYMIGGAGRLSKHHDITGSLDSYEIHPGWLEDQYHEI